MNSSMVNTVIALIAIMVGILVGDSLQVSIVFSVKGVIWLRKPTNCKAYPRFKWSSNTN